VLTSAWSFCMTLVTTSVLISVHSPPTNGTNAPSALMACCSALLGGSGSSSLSRSSRQQEIREAVPDHDSSLVVKL
jgi:hypothetical protein